MKFLHLPYNIAVLDIECLALLPLNPVVDEIGVIFTNMIPMEGVLNTRFAVLLREALLEWNLKKDNYFEYKEVLYHPGVLEQIVRLGNVVEKKTVDFRSALPGNENFWRVVQNRSQVPLTETWNKFNEDFALMKPAEVWINHPEFDLPRIQNAFGPVFSEFPFKYSIVDNIATCRRLLKKHKLDYEKAQETHEKHHSLVNNPKHTALGDCRWNLWMLAMFAVYQTAYPDARVIDINFKED